MTLVMILVVTVMLGIIMIGYALNVEHSVNNEKAVKPGNDTGGERRV